MSSFKSKLLSGTIKKVKPVFTNFPISKQRMGMQLLNHIRNKPKNVHLREEKIGSMTALWAIPENRLDGKVILYTHGGSYVSGSPQTHIPVISRLADTSRIAVMAYDYRLAPEHPYPAALEDAVTAFEYLLSQEYSEENIVVCGDSAGGGLTLAMVMALRDKGKVLPAAVCLLSPWTDLTESSDSHYANMDSDPLISSEELREAAVLYAGEEDFHNPYISPLFGDFTGFPPALIQVGSEEVLLDDSTRLAERLAEKKIEVHIAIYEGMWHVFQTFDVPEAYAAVGDIAEFIHKKIGAENMEERKIHPGAKYRHFKGKYYRVLYVARHSETLEDMVVYQQLYGEHGVWVRPLNMFMETVERDGKRMYRFEEVPEDAAE